jgi:hypothetical protein
VIVVPAAETLVGDAVFTTWIAGPAVAVTVSESLSVTAGPDGGVPETVAVFVIEPASRSACVTAYVAVQVMVAAGTMLVLGQVIGDKPTCGSVTPTELNVTLPVFVTTNEYVTV